ncbi:G-type lectin S-receptor-like serine/threonine-protein kinase [Tanacetum coccineum]
MSSFSYFQLVSGRKLSIRYWHGNGYWHVWVANPNSIVMSSSFDQVLSIDPDTGNLIITSEGKIITNITDIDVGPNPNVTATLEDNGNFRLINEVDKRVLWQSFDYPNVVLMPDQEYFYPEGNPLVTPWVLTSDGRIDVGNYNYNFLTPEFCYGIETRMGCMKGSGLPECRTENDNFSKQNGEFVTDVTTSVTDSNLSLGISDCFVKCWNSCSCVGFNSSNDNGTGCVFWNGMKRFSPNPHENSTLIYVISSQNQISPVTVNSFAKSLMLISEEERRRRSDEYFLELTASESFTNVHQLENKGGNGNDLLIFSFASIMDATEEFSSLNKLGQGGFGPVYKGRLKDGQEKAIKRLSTTSKQGLVEFKNELILIAKLQHTNLVRVLGCCIHGIEKMLIYEYMPNKCLDSFPYDEKKKAELDWPTRVKIIEGIAQGLLYLHKYSRMRVIHRDLKASNILLDECMNPKISNFGMARIFKRNEAEAMTSRVVGTL